MNKLKYLIALLLFSNVVLAQETKVPFDMVRSGSLLDFPTTTITMGNGYSLNFNAFNTANAIRLRNNDARGVTMTTEDWLVSFYDDIAPFNRCPFRIYTNGLSTDNGATFQSWSQSWNGEPIILNQYRFNDAGTIRIGLREDYALDRDTRFGISKVYRNHNGDAFFRISGRTGLASYETSQIDSIIIRPLAVTSVEAVRRIVADSVSIVGAANRLAFFNGVNSIIGDEKLTYNGNTFEATTGGTNFARIRLQTGAVYFDANNSTVGMQTAGTGDVIITSQNFGINLNEVDSKFEVTGHTSKGAQYASIPTAPINETLIHKKYVDDKDEAINTITGTGTVTCSSTIRTNLIDPGSNQTSLTINLPSSPTNGQICKIVFGRSVTTTLTIQSGSSAIVCNHSITCASSSIVTTAVIGNNSTFQYFSAIGANGYWVKTAGDLQ